MAAQTGAVAAASGRPSTSHSGGAGHAARAAVKAADAAPGDTVITFSEFPVGTAITKPRSTGQIVVFSGA